MGARAYSDSLGRFNQVDPVFEGSSNAYDYAFQNPVVDSDVTGMSGNRNGISCGMGRISGACTLYLSEYRTRMLIDTIWDGVGATGICAAAGAASFITIVGAAAGAVWGIVAAILSAGAMALSHIDDAGHNEGIYFKVYFARAAWYWWGWHYTRWTPYAGYVWHQ